MVPVLALSIFQVRLPGTGFQQNQFMAALMCEFYNFRQNDHNKQNFNQSGVALQIRISGITAEHVCGLKVLIKSVADEARHSQYSARPVGSDKYLVFNQHQLPS